jgi:hypothetical protein
MITYNSYSFTRIRFEVDETGNISMVHGTNPEPRPLLVARGWRKYFNERRPGEGGYIAKGWSKVAIKVSGLVHHHE